MSASARVTFTYSVGVPRWWLKWPPCFAISNKSFISADVQIDEGDGSKAANRVTGYDSTELHMTVGCCHARWRGSPRQHVVDSSGDVLVISHVL